MFTHGYVAQADYSISSNSRVKKDHHWRRFTHGYHTVVGYSNSSNSRAVTERFWLLTFFDGAKKTTTKWGLIKIITVYSNSSNSRVEIPSRDLESSSSWLTITAYINLHTYWSRLTMVHWGLMSTFWYYLCFSFEQFWLMSTFWPLTDSLALVM